MSAEEIIARAAEGWAKDRAWEIAEDAVAALRADPAAVLGLLDGGET